MVSASDVIRNQRRRNTGGGGFDPFAPVQVPTQLGDPQFSLGQTPGSQLQFPAAAAEERLFENQTRAHNVIRQANMAGIDTSGEQYDPLTETAQTGFAERALTMGESLLGWIDGPRQAVNLLLQDLLGGEAEEGKRNPNFTDYWNALWGGVRDEDGFELATGLNPRSGSTTLDMFGWAEEEDWAGRVGRGVAHFALDVAIDPLTYVTFGLSGLGKKVAIATGERMADRAVRAIVPRFTGQIMDDAAAAAIKLPYFRTLATNRTVLVNDFIEQLKVVAAKHNGVLPDSTIGAMGRYLDDHSLAKSLQELVGVDELNPATLKALSANDDILELAIRHRVGEDVLKPLAARNFAAIAPEARELLPLYATGGARVSLPFTKRGLEKGWQIPGTIGLGRKTVGQPVREASKWMREHSTAFKKFSELFSKGADEMDIMHALVRGLATPTEQGGIAAWQFHIARTAFDRMANIHATQSVQSVLNSKLTGLLDAAEAAGMDAAEVWPRLMNQLEGADLEGLMADKWKSMFGESAGAAPIAGTNQQLDDMMAETAAYIRETMNSYYDVLEGFDPSIRGMYLDNFMPHLFTIEGSQIMRELATKGANPIGWEAAQAAGNPGPGLLGRLLNGIGFGGRLETNQGATRMLPGDKHGRVAAMTLSDGGTMMIDADEMAVMAKALIGEGGEVGAEVVQRQIPVTQLNEILETEIRIQAAKYNITLPANWDGKIFNENPIDVASQFVLDLEQAIAGWATMDALRAAGLAFERSKAVDMADVIQKMYANIVRNTEAIPVVKFNKPPEGVASAPTSWLHTLGTEFDTIADEADFAFLKSPAEQGASLREGRVSKAEFAADIEKRGIREPVIIGIDPDGYASLREGHHRVAIAQELGIEEIPFEIIDLPNSTPSAVNVEEFLKDRTEWSRAANGPGRAQAIDAFNTLPWKPTVSSTRRRLVGTGATGVVPARVLKEASAEGFPADEAGLNQLRKLYRWFRGQSRQEFVEKAAVSDGGRQELWQVYAAALGDGPLNVGKRGAIETFDGPASSKLHVFRDKDGNAAMMLNVGPSKNAIPTISWAAAPGITQRQVNSVLRDQVLPFLDDQSINGFLKDKLTYNNVIGAIEKGDLNEHGARLMYDFLNMKLNKLPSKTKEFLDGKPGEFIDTMNLYDELTDELNLMFNEISAVIDEATGTLITDPKRLQLVGGTLMKERMVRMRDAARQLGDKGFDEIARIFSRIDDTTGILDTPDFINPGLFALGGPAIQDTVVQRDIAVWLRQLARNAGSIYTPEGMAAAKIATRSTLRWWRAMATIARPSFHIRNHIGAAWNNTIIGVGPKHYLLVKDNALKLRAALKSGMEIDVAIDTLPENARAMFRAAWDNDIMSGFSTTEFRKIGPDAKRSRLAWAKLFDVDDFVLTRAGGKIMESIEDFHRMAAFAAWFDPLDPSSAKVAKEMVEAVHFNYTNLTPFETRVKTLVPFFVWTRRNLPLQMQQAIENPRMIQRYRAMMDAMSDNFGGTDEQGLPVGDNFSAYAAGTDYYVNENTPFWARVVIDPDLPVKDLLDLPRLSLPEMAEYANGLLGPHVTSLFNLNEERDFGDVNAPAPFNAVLRSLAAVGLYDVTTDGDVRIPYHMRTIVETILPFMRETVDPLTGGPSDPNRQARQGIGQDDGTMESALKTLMATLGRGMGIKFNTPADVRGAAARNREQLDALINELRLSGQLAPAPEE